MQHSGIYSVSFFHAKYCAFICYNCMTQEIVIIHLTNYLTNYLLRCVTFQFQFVGSVKLVHLSQSKSKFLPWGFFVHNTQPSLSILPLMFLPFSRRNTNNNTLCWATVIWKKWVIPLINSLLNQKIWFFWQHFISHLTEDNIKWKWIVFIQFCTKHNRICLIQSYEKYCAQIERETWLNASKIAFRSKLQSTCKHVPPETL